MEVSFDSGHRHYTQFVSSTFFQRIFHMTPRLPIAILCVFLVPPAAGAIDLANIEASGALNVEILRFPEWPAVDEQGWGAMDVAADADGWCLLLGRGSFNGGEHYDRLALVTSTGESAEAAINQPVPSAFAETGAFLSMQDGRCTAHWLAPQPPDDPIELAVMELSGSGLVNEMTRLRPAFNHRASFHQQSNGWDWYIAMARAPDPTNAWTDQAYQLVQLSRRDGGAAKMEDLVTTPARFILPGGAGYDDALEALPVFMQDYNAGPELVILRSSTPSWAAERHPWPLATDSVALNPTNPGTLYRWQAAVNELEGTASAPDPGLYQRILGEEEVPVAILPNGSGTFGPMYVNLEHDIAAGDNETWIVMSFQRYNASLNEWLQSTVLLRVAAHGTQISWISPFKVWAPTIAVGDDELWIAGTVPDGPVLFHLTSDPPEDDEPSGKNSPFLLSLVVAVGFAAAIRRRA